MGRHRCGSKGALVSLYPPERSVTLGCISGRDRLNPASSPRVLDAGSLMPGGRLREDVIGNVVGHVPTSDSAGEGNPELVVDASAHAVDCGVSPHGRCVVHGDVAPVADPAPVEA